MENATFTYNYSSAEAKEIELLRKKYKPAEAENKLKKLQKLDRRVKNAGVTQSLITGVVGCLVFGIGMCSGLGAIPGGAALTLSAGIAGALIMLCAYPLFRIISRMAKKKYTPDIMALLEEIEKTAK